MKKCPFCAEEIQDEAIVCRYCGRDLTPPKAKTWRYRILTINYRTPDESGWLNAERTPAGLAAQHFWNDVAPMIAEFDAMCLEDGWEVYGTRDPSCLKLEVVKNSKGYDPVKSVVNAVFTFGGSLLNQAMGFEKWWLRNCTVRWRKEGETSEDDVINLWINPKTNDFEMMEQDPIDNKWYILSRPEDFNPDDLNDNRWDRIPL